MRRGGKGERRKASRKKTSSLSLLDLWKETKFHSKNIIGSLRSVNSKLKNDKLPEQTISPPLHYVPNVHNQGSANLINKFLMMRKKYNNHVSFYRQMTFSIFCLLSNKCNCLLYKATFNLKISKWFNIHYTRNASIYIKNCTCGLTHLHEAHPPKPVVAWIFLGRPVNMKNPANWQQWGWIGNKGGHYSWSTTNMPEVLEHHRLLGEWPFHNLNEQRNRIFHHQKTPIHLKLNYRTHC